MTLLDGITLKTWEKLKSIITHTALMTLKGSNTNSRM